MRFPLNVARKFSVVTFPGMVHTYPPTRAFPLTHDPPRVVRRLPLLLLSFFLSYHLHPLWCDTCAAFVAGGQVLMSGARLADRPVRVVTLCNLAPPPDLYAEAFVVREKYVMAP